jgi:threonine dehydrogenase-like Zn-dependent dehydrogenase
MKVKTEYSIVSRGTEKYQNKGYIAISCSKNGFRYIQDIDHGTLISDINNHSLKIKDNYSIENIALSRFEMIPELLFSRINFSDNILLCGFGNIGYATLNSLISHGFKNISVLIKNNEYLLQLLCNQNEVNIVSSVTEEYNTYIDTTGSSQIIKNIFENCSNMSSIVILSTPKEKKYLIDPLIINRKNLMIYGGHEINGYSQEIRNKTLNKLLKKNKAKNLSDIVSISNYSSMILKKLRMKKRKIYDIIKY